MWRPTDESGALLNRIFDLKVEQRLEPMEIARVLDISHQTVYEVVNSPVFTKMEKEYWDAFDKEVEEVTRRARLRAKKTLLLAAPSAAEALALAARDNDPSVRSSQVRAAESILTKTGVGIAAEGPRATAALLLLTDEGAIAEIRARGIEIPESITGPGHSAGAVKGIEAAKEINDSSKADS